MLARRCPHNRIPQRGAVWCLRDRSREEGVEGSGARAECAILPVWRIKGFTRKRDKGHAVTVAG